MRSTKKESELRESIGLYDRTQRLNGEIEISPGRLFKDRASTVEESENEDEIIIIAGDENKEMENLNLDLIN